MSRKILNYAASVPLSVQSGSTLIPNSPARLQLAGIGIFIPNTAAGANRVELTACVGILKNVSSSTGRIFFRIFRDGNEIFNGIQYTPSSGPPGAQTTTFAFETIDFNVPAGFHTYAVTVESLISVNSVAGPITFSGAAISTADILSNNQVLNYQAAVPRSVSVQGNPILLATSPSNTQLAGLGIFIPQSGSSPNRIQLKATVGVEGLTDTGTTVIFRMFRDGVEIFNEQLTLFLGSNDFNLSTMQTIDFNGSTGFHVYTVTAETSSGTSQAIGPISFSGWVIGADTQISPTLPNQVLDYAASVPRSVSLPGNPMVIPMTPARLQLAGLGIFIPVTPSGANRVQLTGTIGAQVLGGIGSAASQLIIRIFRDGSEIFNAPYALVNATFFNCFSVQAIDFNVPTGFHVYSMTIEVQTVIFNGVSQVIGPITLSGMVIGPLG
ncbi:hypothetical protein [Marininema halotolerans]|uniref:Uncharacterized protein n=1 Tax=Marininema halotolerans TaxID=1155944 RepID=A0A1I6R4T4_9BACL|nr:hypothetical protein [Marininema halotolerans]SFS59508.1 hypothetical protein SAMN05444972_104107 [Marininema halotolerans]